MIRLTKFVVRLFYAQKRSTVSSTFCAIGPGFDCWIRDLLWLALPFETGSLETTEDNAFV